MSEQRYSLTKPENDRLTNLLSVARMQEEILNSVTLAYKNYLTEIVFLRLGIDTELFKHSAIELQSGEIVINQPKDENRRAGKNPNN